MDKSAMHINVQDILAHETGHRESFIITDESPDFDLVTLTAPINGEITISRLDQGVIVGGRIVTSIELECHRCLRSFARHLNVRLDQLFTEQPQDDEMPIDPEDRIDLAPLLQQEILLSLPIKQLCRDDCPGVADAPEGLIVDGPDHSLGSTARITKGP